jgi:hypothetical protein
MVTKMAGTIAMTNIQRQALRFGTVTSTAQLTAAPASAPTARKANAASTMRPRPVLGLLSEMIMCAVG